jgi:hypothetical protein
LLKYTITYGGGPIGGGAPQSQYGMPPDVCPCPEAWNCPSTDAWLCADAMETNVSPNIPVAMLTVASTATVARAIIGIFIMILIQCIYISLFWY